MNEAPVLALGIHSNPSRIQHQGPVSTDRDTVQLQGSAKSWPEGNYSSSEATRGHKSEAEQCRRLTKETCKGNAMSCQTRESRSKYQSQGPQPGIQDPSPVPAPPHQK